MIEDKRLKPYQHLPYFTTIRYPDGSEYNGQIFQSKRHGRGRLFSTPMDFRDGEWFNDELNGKGICQMPNGDRYEGDFSQGKFEGNGQLFYNNDTWYKGEFHKHVKHGQGTETYPNGMVYTGQFENNKPNGRGVRVKGEYSYEGGFHDGQKEGQGKENFKEASYTGTFWRDQKHGKGVWEHKNGAYYKGDWYMGQKQGYGVDHKIEFKENGEKKVETYEGELYEGRRNGFGRLTFGENDSYYYGFWQTNCKYGQFIFYDGNTKEYSIRDFDFDIEVGKPRSIFKPSDEQDGFRSIIEMSALKGEKVRDATFNTNTIFQEAQKFFNLDGDSIEWASMTELVKASNIQFFPSSEQKGKVEISKYSNFQLLPVLLSLFDHYPTQLMKLFNPQYSIDMGYYIVKFFISGEWKQVLVDDLIPVLKENRKPLNSIINSNEYVGFSIIEKAWAKLTGSYFSCYKDPLKAEGVIEAVTGVSPVSFNSSNLVRLKGESNMKFAVPNKSFAESLGLPRGYFYTIIDYIEEESVVLYKLRSFDKSYVYTNKSNNMTNWPEKLQQKLKLADNDEANVENTFWLEYDDLSKLFEYFLVCPLQEGFYHFSFLRKGHKDQLGVPHEMRFFEFEVPFKTVVTMVVTQLLDSQNENAPIRFILTKKIDSGHYEYIFGKGQFKEISMEKTSILTNGTYILCVHIEYPKEIPREKPLDISVVLQTLTSLKLKPEISTIPEYLNKAYSSCAVKLGNKTDLGKFPNGSDKLIFYERFGTEDGVFMQHFVNGTDNIRWKFTINFALNNMRIIGFPQKQQVEILVEPKKSRTLLIMQTGGNSYSLDGGQGYVNLEVIDNTSVKGK